MAVAAHDFGGLLRRARLGSGLTQEQLAERTGLSTRAISDLERGKVARPRGSSLSLLVGALDLDEAAAAALLLAARGDGRPDAADDGPVVSELPAGMADFTGREHELALLADRASAALTAEGHAPVVLVLSGAPGVGKTSLAVRLGHLLAARHPIPQLFVELGDGAGRPLPPAAALRQLLVSLGVPDQDCPADFEQRERKYRSLLYHRQALVLLDNAAGEAQVRPLLPAGPGCIVVVTSRNALEGLSPTVRVGLEVWSDAEARAFLVQVAGAQRVAAEPAAGDEVIRLCGRLPLALRIVGNQLAVRPSWSLGYLAGRLRDESRRLSLLSAGDLGVLPAFELAYRQLSDEARAVFRRLALLPAATFGADVAEVLGEPASVAASAFDELVAASLIQAGGTAGRYQLHDLLRLYARRELDTEPAQAIADAERRIVGWLLDRAAAAAQHVAPKPDRRPRAGGHADVFGDRNAAMLWLDAELPAVLAAAGRAAPLGLAGEAIAAADELSWYFDRRCQWHAWQRLCELLLPAAREHGEPLPLASLLNSLGLALSEQRRFAEAISLHDEAAALAQSASGGYETGLAWDFRALALAGLGRTQEAVAGHLRAREQFQAAGHLRGEAMAMNHCGTALRRAGRLEEAIAWHQRSLPLLVSLGDDVGMAMTRLSLGLALSDLKSFEAAVQEHTKALAGFEESQDLWGQARALAGIGIALRAGTGEVIALPWLLQACEVFTLIDDPAGERDTLRALADVLRAVGRDDEAAPYAGRLAVLDAIT